MRVRTPYFEILKAVYARLTADLPALIAPTLCPVFSLVAPENQVMPYAVISTVAASPSTYKGHGGRKVQCVIDIYSDKLESAAEIASILNAVLESLSRVKLELENDFSESYGLGNDQQSEFSAEPDVNGVVYHGTIRYEWTVEDQKAR